MSNAFRFVDKREFDVDKNNIKPHYTINLNIYCAFLLMLLYIILRLLVNWFYEERSVSIETKRLLVMY